MTEENIGAHHFNLAPKFSQYGDFQFLIVLCKKVSTKKFFRQLKI